jgi:hypothetical protein
MRTPIVAPRAAALAGACLLACVAAGPRAGQAQGQFWCAEYKDGTRECGIPNEESCRQSVSGVGGICEPESESEARPRKPFPILRQLLHPPGANLPMSDPGDMPPPPVR